MYENIRELFLTDIFAVNLGIRIDDIGEGRAAASLEISGQMLNGARVANGGVTFTLADYALAIAANTLGENISLTSNVNINYCGAVRQGDMLTAEASVGVKKGRNAFLSVNVRNQKGEVVALAQSMTTETSRSKIENN